MAEGPLAGVTVIDLTHYIAGPYCTKLLAGMGAEVIKVERPGSGDATRSMGPFPDDIPDPEKSGTFLYLNTGKKSITLNLKSATAVRLLTRIVEDADVLVENFEPGLMIDLGLGYETLSRVNPRLTMTSISNFGQTGPYRDYRADEMTIQAMGGFMYLGGAPEREPLRLGFSAAQYMGGLAGLPGQWRLSTTPSRPESASTWTSLLWSASPPAISRRSSSTFIQVWSRRGTVPCLCSRARTGSSSLACSRITGPS